MYQEKHIFNVLTPAVQYLYNCGLLPFSAIARNKQMLDSEWLTCYVSSAELQTSLHKHLILFRNWNWAAGMWAWVACHREKEIYCELIPPSHNTFDTFTLSAHWVILTAGCINFLQHRCCLFHMEAISEAMLWNEGLA